MIFIDTNVFMYTVGNQHPLRNECRAFFEDALTSRLQLFTSAEVVQELLHVYLRTQRYPILEHALNLVENSIAEVWPLEYEDVQLANQLSGQFPFLEARDLCHLASCRRRGVAEIRTFDKALGSAFN